MRANYTEILDLAGVTPSRVRKLSTLSDSLNLTDMDAIALVKAFQKRPVLLHQSVITLSANITHAANLIGLPKEAYLKAALRHPQLFYQSPNTIQANVTKSAALVGVELESIAVAFTKHPPLFSFLPETLAKNVERSSELIGIGKEVFVSAAIKSPQLFCQKPETLSRNVETSASLLGVSKATFSSAALRHPPLLSQKPCTLSRKSEYLRAIQEARNEPYDLEAILRVCPASLSYGTRRLHARYIMAKLNLGSSALSSLLAVPEREASAAIRSHFMRQHGTRSVALRNLKTLGILKDSQSGNESMGVALAASPQICGDDDERSTCQ